MIRFLLIVLCAACTLTGCLEYESRIKVRPDGSGVLIETMKFNEETADFIREMAGAQSDAMTSDMFNEDELRAKAENFGEGVTFVSGKKITENGKVGYVAVYAFTNVEKLSLGQKSLTEKLAVEGVEPGYNTIEDPSVGMENPGDRFALSFTKGDPSVLKIRVFPEEELRKGMEEAQQDDAMAEALSDTLQDSYLRMMKVFMEGMKMRFVVEPEGTIVETNAANRVGKTITLLEIDMDKLLGDDAALKRLIEQSGQQGGQPQNMEELRRFFQTIPGFSAELGEVVIRFR